MGRGCEAKAAGPYLSIVQRASARGAEGRRGKRAPSAIAARMTRTPAIMIQGTGSNVGKSLIVAGLARAFADRGLKVAPFKPQNMSNNAGVTADGGEIGRAQMLQARAARVAPSVHMNPVLLKPETETGAQVIVQGKRWATLNARDYGERKSELLPAVLESFAAPGGHFGPGAGRGGGVAGRDQSAARRHRQHGLCRGGRRAGRAGRRYRPRRRDRGAGRHARGARAGRTASRKSVSSSTASAAILRFSMRGWRRSRGAPAGRRSASCRIFADAGRLPAEDVLGLSAEQAEVGRARSGSRCRGCRASPISTTSIRSAPSPTWMC